MIRTAPVPALALAALLALAAPAAGQPSPLAEHRLNALFAGAEATPEALRAALDHLATLQAALRSTHLHAHLETKALLTETQVARYTHLRGYAAESTHHGHHHGHP